MTLPGHNSLPNNKPYNGSSLGGQDNRETSKKDGGRVYIQIGHDGEVTVHAGYITDKEAARREKAEANGEGSASTDRPELTKAMQTYLDLHRHAAVRSELLNAPGIALRLATAQIIAASDLWAVSPEWQKAGRADIEASLTANTAQETFADERKAVQALLGQDENPDHPVISDGPHWQHRDAMLEVFARLVKLDDETVTRIFTFVVAETLPSGSVLVEAAGQLLKTDMADHWSPDESFFDLLRDKEAINAMVKEIGGKAVADAHIASTAKVQKSVIRQHMDGTRKPHKPDWQPRYMAFPMKGYTKRGGIKAVEHGKEVKKAISAA